MTERTKVGSINSDLKSFLIEDLLGDRNYAFFVVAVNQYNISSADDDNVIRITTLPPTVPSIVANVSVSNITGGFLYVSFSPVNSTGGFSRASIAYKAVISPFSPCFSSTSVCSSCTHFFDSESGFYQPLFESCVASTCATSDDCCVYGDNECGIPAKIIYNCPTSTSPCGVNGMQASTLYIISMVAKNTLGFGAPSNNVFARTRCD